MRFSLMAAGVLACLALASPAAAQTVDELVARHVAARGGYEKLKAVQTIKIDAHGGDAVQQREGRHLQEAAEPVPRRADGAGAADGRRAGSMPTRRGTPFRGRSRSARRRWRPKRADIDADFDGLLVDWKAKGHTVTLEGTEPLAGGDAYKLKVVTKGGAERSSVSRREDATSNAARPGLIVLPNGRKEKHDARLQQLQDCRWHPVRVQHRRGPQRAADHAVVRDLHGKDRAERADGRTRSSRRRRRRRLPGGSTIAPR